MAHGILELTAITRSSHRYHISFSEYSI